MSTTTWQGIAKQLLENTDLGPRLRPYVRPSSSEFVSVFGAGIVLGAVAGMFLASNRGRELREQVGQRVHEMRESFSEGRGNGHGQQQE